MDDRPADGVIERAQPDSGGKRSWPSVYIRPLRNLTDEADFNVWCAGMASEIACELNRYPCDAPQSPTPDGGG